MTTNSPAAARPATSVPISISHQGQRVDLSVPGRIPVAELLPGMVNALGRLNAPAATQGFRVVLPNGTELDQSLSLADQQVHAGSVLVLEPAGTAASDHRYDDLVEAIAQAVDTDRRAWNAQDSVHLSAYSASGLFVVAAALLALRGDQPVLTAAVAGVGAILVTLAAMLLVRIPALNGATALALSVPALTAALGAAVSGDARSLGAGIGAAVGSMAAMVLPQRLRGAIAGPLLVGGSLIVYGGLVTFSTVTSQQAASVVVALATILVLSAPWIGLAHMPARIEALRLDSTHRLDPGDVARQVANADVVVVAIRVATGLVTIASAPAVAVDLSGTALMTCVGLAAMLGTRSLYSQLEVMVSMISGLLTVLAAGAAVGIAQPTLAWWLIVAVSTVGTFVLAWNVIDQRWRPWLNRVANGVQVLSLMAIPPLTLWVFGVV